VVTITWLFWFYGLFFNLVFHCRQTELCRHSLLSLHTHIHTHEYTNTRARTDTRENTNTHTHKYTLTGTRTNTVDRKVLSFVCLIKQMFLCPAGTWMATRVNNRGYRSIAQGDDTAWINSSSCHLKSTSSATEREREKICRCLCTSLNRCWARRFTVPQIFNLSTRWKRIVSLTPWPLCTQWGSPWWYPSAVQTQETGWTISRKRKFPVQAEHRTKFLGHSACILETSPTTILTYLWKYEISKFHSLAQTCLASKLIHVLRILCTWQGKQGKRPKAWPIFFLLR
jgi:hypothetical protein